METNDHSAPVEMLSDDKYHEYVWPDGSQYKGYVRNGKKHGNGLAKFADGSIYDGQWHQDAIHGQGEYTYAGGNWYSGKFEGGKRHGKGICVFSNGCQYEGEWQSDKPHGYGECRYADGHTFKGFFATGLFQGTGSTFDSNGNLVRSAAYANGQCITIFTTIPAVTSPADLPKLWPDASQHRMIQESQRRERSQAQSTYLNTTPQDTTKQTAEQITVRNTATMTDEQPEPENNITVIRSVTPPPTQNFRSVTPPPAQSINRYISESPNKISSGCEWVYDFKSQQAVRSRSQSPILSPMSPSSIVMSARPAETISVASTYNLLTTQASFTGGMRMQAEPQVQHTRSVRERAVAGDESLSPPPKWVYNFASGTTEWQDPIRQHTNYKNLQLV